MARRRHVDPILYPLSEREVDQRLEMIKERARERYEALGYSKDHLEGQRRKAIANAKRQGLSLRQYRAKTYLKYRYGLTPADVERICNEQGNLCPICGRVITPHTGKTIECACVDHDHATGKVRAILCGKCNPGIGFFDDDPERLRRAAAYLEKHGSAAIPPAAGRKCTIPAEAVP